MISSDDLQHFLEVARTQRLGDAARRLDVDQTTVSRRITRLEKSVGQRLFDRTPTGWHVTETGRRLVPHAEAVEASLMLALEDAGSGISNELSGSLRVLAPDGFGLFVLIPGLKNFASCHPHLSIEVATATSHDLLTGRDFDIGVSLERPGHRSMHTERLAQYQLRLYASQEYLDEYGTPTTIEELRRHRLIWYIETLLDVQPLQIMDTVLPGAPTALQANNIAGHLQAARHGLGIAPLPTYIGRTQRGLVEVLGGVFAVDRTYWLVIPRDLARLARVRQFVNALRGITRASRDLVALS